MSSPAMSTAVISAFSTPSFAEMVRSALPGTVEPSECVYVPNIRMRPGCISMLVMSSNKLSSSCSTKLCRRCRQPASSDRATVTSRLVSSPVMLERQAIAGIAIISKSRTNFVKCNPGLCINFSLFVIFFLLFLFKIDGQ